VVETEWLIFVTAQPLTAGLLLAAGLLLTAARLFTAKSFTVAVIESAVLSIIQLGRITTGPSY